MRKVVIIFASIVVGACFFAFLIEEAQPRPALVYKSFKGGNHDGIEIVSLELQNTTGKPVWIASSGNLFSPYVTRWMSDREGSSDAPDLSNSSFYSMFAKKISPGTNLLLEFAFIPSKRLQQVGIFYYTGNFRNEQDFLNHLNRPATSVNASYKERMMFYYYKCDRLLRRPKPAVAWCDEPLTFHKENLKQWTQNPPDSSVK